MRPCEGAQVLPAVACLLFYDPLVDRSRARTVSIVSFVLALAAGLGAGVYWAWWHGKNRPFNPDPTPSMLPWVALAIVAVIAITVAVVVALVAFLTPDRD